MDLPWYFAWAYNCPSWCRCCGWCRLSQGVELERILVAMLWLELSLLFFLLRKPSKPSSVRNTGFLSQMGNGSKTGFSICVSLFILIESKDGNFVKWHLPWMVSGMGPFQKMRHASQESIRISTALLHNVIVPISLMKKLRLGGGNMPRSQSYGKWGGGQKDLSGWRATCQRLCISQII